MLSFFKRFDFQRITNQRYMAEVDGLRFLAIVPVLLLHFRTAFLTDNGVYSDDDLNGVERFIDSVLLTGDVGVLVFFSISGFILALPFAKYHLQSGNPVHLGRYFLKRLTRLEPPYIITLILFLCVHIVLQTESLSQLLQHFWASLLYSHNWIYQTWSLINPVAWSLEIEVQFYIIVPLISQVFAIRNTLIRRMVIVAGIVAFPLLRMWVQPSFMSLLDYGQYFLTGFFVADIFIRPIHRLPSKVWLDWVGVVGIVMIFVLRYYKMREFLPLALFVVFMAALYGGGVHRVFKTRWIAIVGGMCYITYLIHFPLFFGLMKVTNNMVTGVSYSFDFVIFAIVLIPIVVGVSAVMFLLFEKPFMRNDWPQRFYQWIRHGKVIDDAKHP
jgi:peptidoglycan/LPS O-acetylase OafA/YrhL